MRRNTRRMSSKTFLLEVLILVCLWLSVTTTTSISWRPRLPSSKSKSKANDDAKSWGQGRDVDKETSSPLSSLQLEPLLQVPCSLQMVPNADDKGHVPKQFAIGAFCDTGAQRTCMSWQAAKRVGLAHLMDSRYAGQATGVGLCRVLGRIPAQTVMLQFGGSRRTFLAPAITVLESTGTPQVELLFGLDFLRETQAVINLQEEFLQLTSSHKGGGTAKIQVPFLRPRQSLQETVQVKEEEEPSRTSMTFCPSEERVYIPEQEEEDDNDSDTDYDQSLEDNTMDMSGL